MVQIVRVNPYDKTGFLLPFVVQRILEFARQHMEEMGPEQFTKHVIGRLTIGDPTILVLAFVGAQGDVVGHGAASIENDGQNKWVFIAQCRVEPGEGSSDPTVVRRALEYTDEWAKSHGATTMLMASTRSDEAWRRRYNFKTYRHIMGRPVGSPIPGPGPKEG